jgi:hypothetical protein
MAETEEAPSRRLAAMVGQIRPDRRRGVRGELSRDHGDAVTRFWGWGKREIHQNLLSTVVAVARRCTSVRESTSGRGRSWWGQRATGCRWWPLGGVGWTRGRSRAQSVMQGHTRLEARGWLLLSSLAAAWSGRSWGAGQHEDGECGRRGEAMGDISNRVTRADKAGHVAVSAVVGAGQWTRRCGWSRPAATTVFWHRRFQHSGVCAGHWWKMAHGPGQMWC